MGLKERDRTVRECEVGMVDLWEKRYDGLAEGEDMEEEGAGAKE